MSLKDLKITTADYAGKDMEGFVPTGKYEGSATLHLKQHDKIIKELVAPRLNALIDELDGDLTDVQTGFDTLQSGFDQLKTGWTPVSGWSYASATTINVPAGATSLYTKGDKFKLTANGVELLGYIVGITDTLLTVIGDALTNHAFTDCFVSKVSNPQGFKARFGYTATLTGFSPTPVFSSDFSINGRICYVYIGSITGTSNSGQFSISLPITSSGSAIYYTVSVQDNGGGYSPGLAELTGGNISLYINHDGNSFTASGTKSTRGLMVSYRI